MNHTKYTPEALQQIAEQSIGKPVWDKDSKQVATVSNAYVQDGKVNLSFDWNAAGVYSIAGGEMTDLEATLAEILDAPDDDFPRLAYADLLEEAGQGERAEFIRLQLELAKGPYQKCLCEIPCRRTQRQHPCPTVEERLEKLRKREQELKALTWTWADINIFGFADWRRGFIEGVASTWENWHTHADEITAAHPIKEVRLTTWPGKLGYFQGQQIWVIQQEECGNGGTACTLKEREQAVKSMLLYRWEKIHFELPQYEMGLDLAGGAATLKVNGETFAANSWQVIPEPQPPKKKWYYQGGKLKQSNSTPAS